MNIEQIRKDLYSRRLNELVAIDEERERIKKLTFSPFLDFSGFVCKHLSLYTHSLLELGESPLIVGGNIDLSAVAQFLWVHSLDYSLGAEPPKQFIKKVKKLDGEAVASDLIQYFNDVMSSFPETMQETVLEDRDLPILPTTSLVVQLASQLGWKEEDILNLPILRVSQYLTSIWARDLGHTNIYNKKREVIGRYLTDLNAANKAHLEYLASLEEAADE